MIFSWKEAEREGERGGGDERQKREEKEGER
jgi:hypothetical protein